MAMTPLSIIICTYSRPRLLVRCLDSIAQQSVSLKNCELIVVDNNSTTNIKRLVDQFRLNYPFIPLTYIKEKKPGITYARTAGAQAARGRYLAYIDDDAYASPNWVKKILETIDRVTPDVCGGIIYPYYNSSKPKWFKDKYEKRVHGRKARLLKEGEYFAAANFIIRKSVLEDLNYFPISLGMTGKDLGYGEETRLLINLRTKTKHPIIFYNPQIIVYHLVAASKMSLVYRLQSCFIAGRYALAVFGYSSSKWRLVPIMATILEKTLIGFFARNKKKYSYYQNYLWEKVLPYFYEFGTLWPKR